jgi:hypothetical protein
MGVVPRWVHCVGVVGDAVGAFPVWTANSSEGTSALPPLLCTYGKGTDERDGYVQSKFAKELARIQEEQKA